MAFLRAHVLAVAVVVVATTSAGAVFLIARPEYRPQAIAQPPDHGLPYAKARYTATDARRAFARVGIALSVRSRSPFDTTLANPDDALEVDAFSDADKVARAGFWDYVLVDRKYEHFPRSCGTPIPDAERWHGNVRVIVSCRIAGAAAPEWLRRADRALADL